MSQLKSTDKVKINFANGFTMFASIKIQPQKNKGRKVIFQIVQSKTLLKITLGLNETNDLFVWLEDTRGHTFKSNPVDKNLFFQKSVFLHFSVIPRKVDGELPKLELGINEFFIQTSIDANLGVEEEAQYSIGSNFDGKENAAFNMAALAIYKIALTQFQLQEISKALAKEMGDKNGK